MPEQAQARLWASEIVPLLKQSAYWKPKLNTQNLSAFPITTYEDYEEGLMAAQNALIQPFNGEALIFWSETSGTTGLRKFFPITASFQKQFQRTMPPFIHSLTQRFPGFFKEKILYLVAVDAHQHTPAGTPLGWISHYNYAHLPAFIKRFYAMPDAVFDNHDIYYQWAGLYALASDLSAVFAVTPMVIAAFYERCVSEFDHYMPYLLGEKELPAHLPTLAISTKRRAYLRTLANNTNRSFKAFWPSLVCSGCWTSGLCEYPAQQLQTLMGPEITLVDGTYSATEGWLTVPLDADAGGVLHPGAHVIEFIKEGDEIIKENLLPCWALNVGSRYEVFLTTAMGFVRYRLKDTVLCTGFFNKSPRLVFCYKTQVLKLESCAVSGQELLQAVDEASFNMAAHWYFARNNVGNRILLVTDDEADIPQTQLDKIHQRLILISPTYAHSVETGEVIPLGLWQLPKVSLLADQHGQTKPKLIDQRVIADNAQDGVTPDE